MGFLPWEKFGLSSPGKASCDTVALPNPRCMLGVLCFHNPPNSGVNYGIFKVSRCNKACDCTRGCKDTVREPAPKVDSGRKILCRTGESNLRQRRAGPMLYQLSYVPTPIALYKSLGKLRRPVFSVIMNCRAKSGACEMLSSVQHFLNTESAPSPAGDYSQTRFIPRFIS